LSGPCRFTVQGRRGAWPAVRPTKVSEVFGHACVVSGPIRAPVSAPLHCLGGGGIAHVVPLFGAVSGRPIGQPLHCPEHVVCSALATSTA